MTTKKSLKIPCIYTCNFCNYNTSSLKDYNKHLLTKKHINNASTTNNNAINPIKKVYVCINCNKEHNDRAGLWRHKKKCVDEMCNITSVIKEEDITNKELIAFLIKQNKELMEVIKNGTHNTTNNTTNNNINKKTFNLQFFLNETCKDALNINDFVNNINPQLKDLENMTKEGYVGGISNIIIKELKNMDISKRPIHCSDIKRETLYIKDNNSWEKENEQKQKMKKVIKEISNKNIRQLPIWMNKHPHHKDYDHPDNDDYLNIIRSCMAGEEVQEDIDKIIKIVSKEVVIDK